MKNRSLRERVGFAIAGWREAFRRERSFRTQCLVAMIALIALLLLRPAPIWWAIVALTSFLVLALELINASLEALVDLIHPEHHSEIRFVKDALAGAVLMISVAALVIATALILDRAPLLPSIFDAAPRP